MTTIAKMAKYTYDPEADAFAIDPSKETMKNVKLDNTIDIAGRSSVIIDMSNQDSIISIEMLDASKLLNATKKALSELKMSDIDIKFDMYHNEEKEIYVLDVHMAKIGGFRVIWDKLGDYKEECIMPINPDGSFSAARSVHGKESLKN